MTAFTRPTLAEIAWTVALGLAAAVFTSWCQRVGYLTKGLAASAVSWSVPAVGVVVALLAIAFAELTDKGVDQVLFSGQDALPGLVEQRIDVVQPAR